MKLHRREVASPSNTARWMLIAVALFLPTIVTYVYFSALADTPWSLAAAAIGKTIQFALPVAWVFWVCREKVVWRWPNQGDLLIGAASGMAILAAMLALYFGWLRSSALFAAAAEPIVAKIADFHIDSLGKYLVLTLFYALVHSLLEEYYWRWFVFAQLRKLVPLWPAILISSAGFATHHVLVLGRYFGYGGASALLTCLFTLGVFLGGVIWSRQFAQHRSLWGVWLSHLLVDATIFLIGLDIVSDAL